MARAVALTKPTKDAKRKPKVSAPAKTTETGPASVVGTPEPAPTCTSEAVQAGEDSGPAASLPESQPRAHTAQKAASANLLKVARRERSLAKRAVEAANKQLDRLSTTPQLIYRRDTTRENIATAATLSVLLLIEFVLREYFGGLRVNIRTFIEQFIMLPVTVRTTSGRITYQFHANPRNPKSTNQLREACTVITARALRRSGKLMVFEVIGDQALQGGGSPWVAEMA